MLSTGIVTALQMSAGAWRDARERLTLDRKIANSNRLLHAMFAGMVPVLATPPPSVGAPPAPFFDGEPQQMRLPERPADRVGAAGRSVIEGRQGSMIEAAVPLQPLSRQRRFHRPKASEGATHGEPKGRREAGKRQRVQPEWQHRQ